MQRAIFRTVEELEASIGKHVAQSDWLEVTQLMVDDFARLTKDTQWIHVDTERAQRESPFGTTIAHGFLTLSLLAPLITECITMPPVRLSMNYGFDRVRFISPVQVGSHLRGDFTLQEFKRTPDGVQIAWNVEIAVRDSAKPSLAALWLSRLVL